MRVRMSFSTMILTLPRLANYFISFYYKMIDKVPWAATATFFASAVYQYIVYEYTATDTPKPYDDWHRYAILAVSGVVSAFAVYRLFQIFVKAPYTGQLQEIITLLLCAAPSLILFSYETQKQSAIQNAAIYDWRRDFSHVYSGLSLILMAISAIMAVPAILEHLTKKR